MTDVDRRAHLTDPVLYKAFYRAATEQSPVCDMRPDEPRLVWTMGLIGPTDDVIDLGSHKLDMTIWIRHRTRGRVVAVDIDELALELGKTRPGAEAIETWAGDACALPYPDASFDVAVMAEIVEHVPDEWALIREAERVVRPGGLIVITVPADAEGWDLDGDRATKSEMGFEVDAHVREFVPSKELRGKPELRTRYEFYKVSAKTGRELGFRMASYRVAK